MVSSVLLLQDMYALLARELKTLASSHGERLLHTPHNPVSLGEGRPGCRALSGGRA